MNKDQAIGIIKNIIDSSIKAGLCPNLETSGAIMQAWNIIIQALQINPGQNENKQKGS